jgi:predicted MPP superfamily phosphohydrolase
MLSSDLILHPSSFLLGLAALGHLVLVVGSHNWWYGQPLGKRLGDVLHFLHGALVVAFPLALYLAWGWRLQGLFDLSSAPAGQLLVAGYVGVCLLAAGVLLPAVTVRRLLRREPVLEACSEVVDVARALGRRPEGSSRERLLTRLPGNQVFQVELAQRVLCPARLPPAWDGLTVLHLSDLHLNGTPDRDYFRFVMDRCAAWQPDLVALTGDVADSWEHMRWVVPVLGRLRWRVAAFAILGNHDFWYDPAFIRRRLARVGMGVLGNGWAQVEVRGQPLVVIGHEGPWAKPAPDLAGCPEGPFRLCLSHTPDNIAWARRAGVDLMLSGHVHGGQIRVPPFGSILVPSVYGRRYDCGTFAEGPTLLHVSRGLSGEHPLRFGCRPEVTLLTLRSRP